MSEMPVIEDRAAERAVLGSMLYAPSIIPDVAEVVDAGDFYLPAHEAVFSALVDLASRGEPTDPVAVQNWLRQGSDPAAQAGADHIAELATGTVPGAGTYHAQIVHDRARERRLLAACQQGIQRTRSGGQTDEVVADVLRYIDEAARTKATSDVGKSAADLVAEQVDALSSVREPGITTGWGDLDGYVNGLRPGQLIIVGARPSMGKALALDTPIPTPTGWTTMGDLAVGDWVIGSDGRPTQVVAATEVMHDRDCYEMAFDDGTRIVADAQHEWLTSTRASRRAATPRRGYVFKRDSPFSRDQRGQREWPSVKTTEHIAATCRTGSDGRANHAIANGEPLVLPEANLPLDPYVLGVWLGDGTSRSPQITTADDEIVSEVRRAGYPCRPLRAAMQYTMSEGKRGGRPCAVTHALSELDLLRNKHVPRVYLRASRDQRLALVQGLMDTDGTIGTNGRCSFDVTSRVLALGLRELLSSLGIKSYWGERRVSGRSATTSTCYRVGFVTTQKVFRLPRKRDRLPNATRGEGGRVIRSVTRVQSVPVKCIQVAAEDHMYLAGESMIPTHNSVIAANLTAHACANDIGVHFASLEMTRGEVMNRLLSAESSTDLGRLEAHRLTEKDWDRIAPKADTIRRWPLWVDDTESQSLAQLRARARRTARKVNLGLIVVDYLQLMAPRDRRVPREQQVGELSEGLKAMAKELRVPVVALAQLNRAAMDRQDKRPAMSDLRESGRIEADADGIWLLHRQDMVDPKSASGEMEVLIAKNRNGVAGATVTLQFQGHYSRAVSQAWSPSRSAS